jgi:uncharacterized protein (TIGR03067 family)
VSRTRSIAPLALLALLVPPLVAAPVPKAVKVKGDAERIVGTWAPDGGKAEWYRFDADGTMSAWVADHPNAPNAYTYTLDPTATPKRMTWTVKGEKAPYYHCVYELDGDRLKVVYVDSGKPWPAKVEAASGPYFIDQTRDTSAK